VAPIPISFDVFISTSFLFLAGTPACKKHVRDTNSDPKPRRTASLCTRGSWCASRRPSPGGDHGAPNLVPRYFIEGHGLSTLASRSTTVRAVLAHRHRPHRMARIGEA